MRVKCCDHGDVFIYSDKQIIWSPYGSWKLTGTGQDKVFTDQVGIIFNAESLVEVAAKLVHGHRTRKALPEWLNHLRIADELCVRIYKGYLAKNRR